MIWAFLSLFSIFLVLSYKLFPLVLSLLEGGFLAWDVMKSGAFLLSLRISSLWAFLNSSLLVAVASILAWTFRGKRKLLYAVLFIPWAVPIYLSALVWRFVVYGINGESLVSFLGLPSDIVADPVAAFLWSSLLTVWLDLPLVTLSILSAIDEMDGSLIEAARMDGASDSEVFLNVVIPSISGILEGWFLIQLVRYAHAFTIPFLFVEGGVTRPEWITPFGAIGNVTTLGVLNYKIFRAYDLQTSISFAAATYIFLTVMVAVWIFRKKERFLRIALAGLSVAWYLASGEKWALLSALVSLFPPVLRLAGGLSLGILTSFRDLPSIFLIATGVFSKRWGVIRLRGRVVEIAGWMLVMVFGVFSALTATGLILAAFTEFPDSLTLEWKGFEAFREVLEDGYASSMLNSLLISISVALFSPILSFPLAHWAARKGGDWIVQLFLVLRSISGIHVLSVIFFIYAKLHLLNNLLFVSTLVMANVVPQIMVFLKGFISSIPRELEEVALMEGGSRAAKAVVLRMSLPQISVGVLMGFIAGWNAFLAPLMLLLSDSLYPASVKLYTYVGNLMDLYPRWGMFGAGAILNLSIALAVFASIRFALRMLK